MGLEQEGTLLKKGPGSFLTFVLKARFGIAVRMLHQAATQPSLEGCNFPRAGFEYKAHREKLFISFFYSKAKSVNITTF